LRVFLGNSPWYKEGFYGVRAGSRWPHFQPNSSKYMPFPFFLAYSAAVLERQDDVQALLVDCVAAKLTDEDFFGQMRDFRPDVVVLEVSTISIDVDLACARKVREVCPDAKTVFCGPHTYMFEPDFLKQHDYVDFVMKGEYEYTLRDLVSALQDGKPFDEIAGLLFRSDSGVVFTGDRPVIQNIDELPWPARHFLPMHVYCDTPGDIPMPSVQMWASRGCPYGCVYCAWPQIMYGNKTYRGRDPVAVVDEMEHLIREQGFKSIFFDDDTFNIGKERILKMCAEINRRGLKVPWSVMARADTMDQELLEALKGAGLRGLKYGVESASQEILNRCGKALDLKKVEDMVRLTKKLGIWVHLTFMFGLPGETKDTMNDTINLALSLDPDSLQFSIATPWPGTDFYKEVERKGFLLSKDFSEYDGCKVAVVRTEALTKEDLEAGLKEANARYVSLGNRLKRHIRHPRRFVQRLQRRINRRRESPTRS